MSLSPHDPQAQWSEAVDSLQQLWPRVRRLLPFVVIIIVGLWLAFGIYTVGPGEVGVVRMFGREISQTSPGLHYRLPWPIQTATIVDVATVRRAEIGFRTKQDLAVSVPDEALMLTGDENIVEVQLFVQYVINDASLFLFRARDPEEVLRLAAEVGLRGVVGQQTIDFTMTEGRVTVQEQVRSYLQNLLDTYQTGLLITEARLLVVDPPEQVIDAFHEVVRALEDRSRLVQEAEGYREDVVPRARGEAAEMLAAAEAYKERRTLEARGDVAQFKSVLKEYEKAPNVTRDRLYLEMVDRTLPELRKVIIDNGVAGQTLPLLSLDRLGLGEGNTR